MRRLLIVALTMAALAPDAAAAAMPASCQYLSDLMETSAKPDYPQMRALKSKCTDDLRAGANNQLLGSVRDMDLQAQLDAAHLRRLDERKQLLDSARSITAPIKAASEAAKIQLSDSYLAEQASLVSALAAHLTVLAAHPFETYLTGPLANANRLGHLDRRNQLSDEAIALSALLDRRVGEYAMQSDAEIRKIDDKTKAALLSGAGGLGRLRASVTNLMAQRINNEVMAGIADLAAELNSTRAWQNFLAGAKVQNLLQTASMQFNSGRIESGLATLDFLNRLRANFLVSLPGHLRKLIAAAQSSALTTQITQLRDFSARLTGEQIESRLRGYIAFRAPDYRRLRAGCGSRNRSQEPNFRKIDSDLASLPQLRSIAADSLVRRYVYGSLAERLDVAVALCREDAQ